jgi:DNA-directed RNA polymerase subunit RPC12/RpoP
MKGKTTCPQCKHEFVMDVPEDREIHSITCPQCNHTFTVKRMFKEGEREECGWEEHGEPRKTILSSIKRKTNRPIIASFLLLTAGVLGVFTAVMFSSTNGPLLEELDFVNMYLSGLNIDKLVVSVGIAVFSAFAIIGSLSAFRRRYFLLTLLCAILSIFALGLFVGLVLSIVALVFIILSRDEFENATKGKVF